MMVCLRAVSLVVVSVVLATQVGPLLGEDWAWDIPGLRKFPPHYKCNFDKNMCGWTKSGTVKRRFGHTPTKNTGPKTDASGRGYYAYFETSNTQKGQKFDLRSPTLKKVPIWADCLYFSYCMFGSGVGKLDAYIELQQDGKKIELWSEKGNQGQPWKKATVKFWHKFPEKNKLYDLKIGFIVELTGSSYGDIAIDDVSLGFCYDGPEPIKVQPTPKPLDRYNCNFEQDICKWEQATDDQFDWTRRRGPSPRTWSDRTGPNEDHTLKTAFGHYIFINSQGKKNNDKASIIGEYLTLHEVSKKQCLKFFYSMRGASINKLVVSLLDVDAKRHEIWSKSGSQGEDWRQAIVDLRSYLEGFPKIRVVIEASVGRNDRGDIALDDTALVPCLDLALTCGANDSILTENQGCCYNKIYNKLTHDCCTELERPTAAVNCFSVAVGKTKGMNLCDCRGYTTCWFGSRLFKTCPHGHIFDGKDCVKQTDIPRQCGSRPYKQPQIDCDFDVSICKWTQEHDDDFDWIRKRGATPSANTGPFSDHSGSGYYMYIETSNPRRMGDKAHFSSPLISTSMSCLSFWYCMFGQNIGRLAVFVIWKGRKHEMWSKYGDQGSQWVKADLDFRRIVDSDDEYRVVIEGVVGPSYDADIAVDEFKFHKCAGVIPTTKTKVPDSSDVDSPTLTSYNCHFANTFCSWIQSKDDVFDWELRSKTTPSSRSKTGPDSDHTSRTSHGKTKDRYSMYVFIESSNRKYGDSARLETQEISESVNCFQFWYHMYGATINALSVYVQPSGGKRNLVWTKTKSQGKRWYKALIDLRSYFPKGTKAKVIIEGLTGSKRTGDIAIDDVSFVTCARYKVPSQRNYGCNFDASLCKFFQDTTEKLDWTRHRGSTRSENTGPLTDRSGHGYYMYLESSFGRSGESARLISEPILSSRLCLSFWYHMWGKDIYLLKVFYLLAAGNKNPINYIWQKQGDQGNKWHHALIDLNEYVDGGVEFMIGFEATRWKGYTGDIAIDEVSFRKCRNVPEQARRDYDVCLDARTSCCMKPNAVIAYRIQCCGKALPDCSKMKPGKYYDWCSCKSFYRCRKNNERIHKTCKNNMIFDGKKCITPATLTLKDACGIRWN